METVWIEAAKQVPALVVVGVLAVFVFKHLSQIALASEERLAVMAAKSEERLAVYAAQSEARMEKMFGRLEQNIEPMRALIESNNKMFGAVSTLFSLVETDLKSIASKKNG